MAGGLRKQKIAWPPLFAAALAASVSMPGFVLAQTSTVDPPVRSVTDENGVDLSTGFMTMQFPDVSIGDPAANGIGHSWIWLDGYGARDQYNVSLAVNSTTAQVTIGAQTTNFSRSGSTFTSLQGDGSTLASSGANYIYTMADGTTITLQGYGGTEFAGIGGGTPTAIGTDITQPNGKKLTLTYYSDIVDARPYGGGIYQFTRLATVTTNTGYQLRYSYASDGLDLFNNNTNLAWMTISGVTAVNNGVDCVSCALTQAWPHVTYGLSGAFITSVTDASGRVTAFTNNSGNIGTIRRPGHSIADVTITKYGGSPNGGKVYQIARGANTTTYNWSLSGSILTATITDTLARNRMVTADTTKSVIVTDTDAAGYTTSYGHDGYGRLTSITRPGGQVTSYGYDGRGNLTSTTQVAAAGSGLASLVSTVSFPSSCGSSNSCNKPSSTTDARGNVTTYSYSPSTGQVTQIVYPADNSGGHPTVNYGYSPLYAWYSTNSSSLVAAATPVSMLTTISQCQTSNCGAGSSDEARTTLSYETGSAGARSNLLPVAVAKGSGATPAMQMVTTGYDAIGNATSVDGPLAGSDDTVRMRYDADRHLIGSVGPDPDGGGGLRPRAIKYSFNGATGLIDKVEVGTVTNPTDDPAGLSVLATVDYSYDSLGRKLTERQLVGGAPWAVNSYAYDAAGRLVCAAVRMNMASLPADGCAPGTAGGDGSDRITNTSYDADDHVTQVLDGYGVAPRALVRSSYTANGDLATLIDANGNTTTYEYDGHDRLVKTRYPIGATGSGTSSTTDYESLTYGNSAGGTLGLITSKRLRDGNTLSYAYDNFARVTQMTPSAITWADVPITYAYDYLGRRTQAIDTVYGHNVYYSYDAVGNVTAENGPWRYRAMGYDSAGRMTSLDYGDGFHVTYAYDNVDEMTAVYENGAGWLASYGYDDLGRRTWISRPNGVNTGYTYDAASRLTYLVQDLAGTAGDLTIGLTYNAAGQITQRTSSNDAYAWTDGYNVNRGYAVNGLNQYSSIISSSTITPTYDGRGNTTGTGSASYAYTARNLLLNDSLGNGFYYDALGRLDVDSAASGCAILENEGATIDAELDCSNAATLRRYVYGADSTPLLWYEGAGTGDRRWLTADERGSVIAVTDGSGNAMRINSYDEFGIPGANNLGRFGYTGQAWLPSIGMTYSRARIYSPTLGRFMQTDPIGYGGGPNWYNYVGSDPVNATDPSGLDGTDIVVNGSNQPPGAISMPSGTGGSGIGSSTSGNSIAQFPAEIVVTGKRVIQRSRGVLSIVIAELKGLARAIIPAPSSPQGKKEAAVAAICARRAHHNAIVDKSASQLSSEGFVIAYNVSLRRFKDGKRAVADFIATVPGSGVFYLHEIKTGEAVLSKNQQEVYATGLLTVVGNNAIGLGLEDGDAIPIVFNGAERHPGCGI